MKRHEFVAHASAVRCLAFAPSLPSILATGGDDCRVNVWKLGEGSVSNVWTLSNNKAGIECVCFDTEEQCVLSGSMSGAIRVFDLNEGKLVRSLNGHQVNTTSLHYHPYGELVASGSGDTTMKVWDVRNKRCIQTYTGHKKEVTCVRFSPDGRWVASAGRDNKLLLWDIVAAKFLHTLEVQHYFISSFEFCPTEFILAGVTSLKMTKFWDMESFELMGSTPPETSPIRSLCFSKKSKALCTATESSLKIWEWDPLRSKSGMDVAWDKLSDLSFNKDDSMIMAGSFISNFVSIWQVDYNAEASSSSADSEIRIKTGFKSPLRRVDTPQKFVAPDASSSKGDAKSELRPRAADSKDEDAFVPGVNWESGMCARDLSASMSEGLRLKRVAVRPEAEALSVEALRKDLPSPQYSPLPSPEKKVAKSIKELRGFREKSSRGEDAEDPQASPRQKVVAPPTPQLAVNPAGHHLNPAFRTEVNEEVRMKAMNVVGSRLQGGDEDGSGVGALYNPSGAHTTVSEVINAGTKILPSLSARIGLLRILRKYWERGDIADMVTQLQSMYEGSRHDRIQLFALADFFTSANLASCTLTLDVCVNLLPILEPMSSDQTEYIVHASLTGILFLLEAFGDLIRQTRATMSVGGAVDLSREERLLKCNTCHAILLRIKNNLLSIKSRYRNDRIIVSLVENIKTLLLNW